jgi:hypothetical protein
VSTWQTTSPSEWTFSDRLVTGIGGGVGDYQASYAAHAGVLLNGRIGAHLRLLRTEGVGAGLVCRADGSWNFVAFYTAPAEPDSDLTFARFGVCREGILATVATSDKSIRLGTSTNKFSLEFFSGQLRGQIDTADDSLELRANCVEMPFPGSVGLFRLYGSALMATQVVVQQTSISLVEEPTKPEGFDFDVFICHSKNDRELINSLAETFSARGISYWLDEEQINFGDGVTQKIADGLRRSRFVVPCVSESLETSGWTRAEYSAILNAEFSGDSTRVVIPLVLDESDAKNVPILLRDKRRAFYANKTEFEHFVEFLLRR